jgi:MFS family permease
LLTLLESLMFVLTGDAINQLIPSQQRATLLSLQSMLFSLFMMLLFPLIGKLADWTTLAIAFVVLAALATVVLLTFSIIVGRVLAVPRLFDNPAPK